jgi:ABC-2 type transport system ATP-binding protein
MQEAERLCDRLAVIDAGRVVFTDTPAALVARASKEQAIRFRPSQPLADEWLTDLPDVSGVTRRGEQVVVTGGGNLLQVVVTALAAHDITPIDLHLEQADLDDAFVELIGRRIES